jgi:hypothetical protein
VEVESELGKGTRFRLTFTGLPGDLAGVVAEPDVESELVLK